MMGVHRLVVAFSCLFLGGQEAVKSVVTFLPHILIILKDPSTPTPLRLQVLRTLSQVCNRSRIAQEKVFQDEGVRLTLLDLIGNISRVQECRWACYALLQIVTDNISHMQILKGIRHEIYIYLA